MKPLYPLLLIASTLAHGAELQLINSDLPQTDAEGWLEQTLGVELAPHYQRSSLTGRHTHFYQTWQGIPIAGRFASLSLDQSEHPWRYYHHTRVVSSAPAPCDVVAPLADYIAGRLADPALAHFEADAAQAEAWYWPTATGLVPVWRLLAIEQKSDAPKGTHWQIFLSCDASSEIGRLTQEASTQDTHAPQAGEPDTLQARVFALDPRTALEDASLIWQPEQTLPDGVASEIGLPVTRVGEHWILANAYARVVDAIEPVSAPLQADSPDGLLRDSSDPAFLDINGYYHLSLAQQHVARLGYPSLMGGALAIDTHAGWQDNSLYDPFARRLEIGRSGVPDAEDPMVIWHEFGHAVQHHIVPDLGDGGDWGAIGEGFSDYMAASWRQRSEQGQRFEPFMVFNWDARISGRSPRQLDDLRARYHPDMQYPAHVTVNGSNADQLWGTPLFTALRAAVARYGEGAHDEMDRLLIESHFGLGPDVRMPQLARVTVETARRLYPTRDYAALLEQAFRHHGILQAPLGVSLAAGSYLVPGESHTLPIELTNHTDAPLEVRGNAAPVDQGLTTSGSWQGTIESAGQRYWPLVVTAAADLQCGSQASLPLHFTLAGVAPSEQTQSITLSLPVGEPLMARASGQGGPLNDATSYDEHGLTRYRLELDAQQAKVDQGFALAIDLEHPRLDQLQIWLTSPYGTRVVLWDRAHSAGTRLKGEFPAALQPLEPLDALHGEPLSGIWQLDIVDSEPEQRGTLHSWRIAQIIGAKCEKAAELPPSGIIPLGEEEAEGGAGSAGLGSLLLLLPLIRRLRRHL